MFLGCAGHKRKTGEESENAENAQPEDQQLTPSQAEAMEAGSKVPSDAGKLSNADQSIAGFQSQTSEILAGPGEDMAGGASVISRINSHASHQSKMAQSHVGSTLSSRHQASSNAGSRLSSSHAGSNLSSQHSSTATRGSKFGSTLDSSIASRAAGGGPASVLSVMSRASSNLQSALSSSPSVRNQSRMGASNIGSGITSNVQSGMNSSIQSNMGQKSRASNIASSIMSNAAKSRQSALGSNLSSSIKSKAASGPGGPPVSRVLSSSVQVSGSSPVSSQSVTSPHSSSSQVPSVSGGSSGRSVVTPRSSGSSRQSVK